MLDIYRNKLQTIFSVPVKNTPEERADRAKLMSPAEYTLEAMPEHWLALLENEHTKNELLATLDPRIIYIQISDDGFRYLTVGMQELATLHIDALNRIDLCRITSRLALDDLPEGERSVYVVYKAEAVDSDAKERLYLIDRTKHQPVITDLTEHLTDFQASTLYQRFSTKHFQRQYALSQADLNEIAAATSQPLPLVTLPLSLDKLQELKPIILALIASDGYIASMLEFESQQKKITRLYTQQYDAAVACIEQETLALLDEFTSKTSSLKPAEKREILMACNDRGYSFGQILLEKADQTLILGYLAALASVGEAEFLRDIVLQNELSVYSLSIHQQITSQDPQLVRAYLDCINMTEGTDFFDELLAYRQYEGDELLSVRLARLVCEPEDDCSYEPTSFAKKHMVQLAKASDKTLWPVLCSVSSVDGNHMGQILAENQSSDALEDYIDVLEGRLQTEQDAEVVRFILMHVNEEGNSLLHLINTCQGNNRAVLKKQFLLLTKLSKLLEDGFDEEGHYIPKEARFLDCLSIANAKGSTPGHLIAQRKNFSDIHDYLQLIDHIQDPHLLVLFLQINASGDNLGHLVAESAFKGQGVENVSLYLNILFKIYDLTEELGNLLLSELANLLRQLNRDGFPLGVLIGHDATSMCGYFDLLTRFKDESVFEELFFQETQVPFKYQHTKTHRSNHGLTFSHSVSRCNDPNALPIFVMYVTTHLNSERIALKFLQKKTGDGDSFLTLLAKNQSGHEISVIINHLMKVLSLSNFLDIVHQENDEGENFLSILIERHNSIRTQYFIENVLIEKNYIEIIRFINEFDFEVGRFTLLDFVLRHNNQGLTRAFLKEVFFKIHVNVLSRLMLMTGADGLFIVHQIVSPKAIGEQNARSQGFGIIPFFMSGVLSLMPDAQCKLNILCLTDEHKDTFLHGLARQCKGGLIEELLTIVNLLVEVIGFNDFLKLIHKINDSGNSFLSIIMDGYDEKTIKSFINLLLRDSYRQSIIDFLRGPEIGVVVVSPIFDNVNYELHSLENLILKFGNYDQIKSFLEHIIFEIENSDDFLRFMTSCDGDGVPFVHRVISIGSVIASDNADGLAQHEKLIRLLFENIMDRVRNRGDIETLLSATDQNGNTLWHLIADQSGIKFMLDSLNLWSRSFYGMKVDDLSDLNEDVEGDGCEWDVESIGADYPVAGFELRGKSTASVYSDVNDEDDVDSLMVNARESLCSEVYATEKAVNNFDWFLAIKNKKNETFKDIVERRHAGVLTCLIEGEYGLARTRVPVDGNSLTPSSHSSASLSSSGSGNHSPKTKLVTSYWQTLSPFK